MPLMKIDMLKGRSQVEIKKILDISYEVMKKTFHAPEGDRYQIVTQHEPYEMQILDTGLGFERSENMIVFSLVTRPRTTEEKKNFYSELVKELSEQTEVNPADIMINLTVNSDEDWSFGFGRAQFLTGEL